MDSEALTASTSPREQRLSCRSCDQEGKDRSPPLVSPATPQDRNTGDRLSRPSPFRMRQMGGNSTCSLTTRALLRDCHSKRRDAAAWSIWSFAARANVRLPGGAIPGAIRNREHRCSHRRFDRYPGTDRYRSDTAGLISTSTTVDLFESRYPAGRILLYTRGQYLRYVPVRSTVYSPLSVLSIPAVPGYRGYPRASRSSGPADRVDAVSPVVPLTRALRQETKVVR